MTNLYQVTLTVNRLGSQIQFKYLGAGKPKGLNRINKIEYGYLNRRRLTLPFIDLIDNTIEYIIEAHCRHVSSDNCIFFQRCSISYI
jgi:hypothetical protein